MQILRLVVSDFHLGTGHRTGQLNPLEDFFHDERFAELLNFYDWQAGEQTEIELVFNGDIFDLLKVKIDGKWPIEITPEIATEKLRLCMDGHPVFVHALRTFLGKPGRSLVYLPGNHDLDLWFTQPQELFRRYVAPGPAGARVRFITTSDTYYLPEGIQIRHGHQLETIHRVDYRQMTRKTEDGREILDLPWGSLWILQVMNPSKEERSHIDRIQPFARFMAGALLFDTRFAIKFLWKSWMHFLRYRVFSLRGWIKRIRNVTKMLREEILTIGVGYDEAAIRALRHMRGTHTLVVGHSHAPRYRALPEGRMLINTGTWTRMINLDLRHLGQDSGLTYALIAYSDQGKPTTKLMRWHGQRVETEAVPYVD